MELQEHLERLLAQRLPLFREEEVKAALQDCRRRLERRQLELSKQASGAALATQEAEIGPVAMAEAITGLWSGEQPEGYSTDERAQTAKLGIRDLEAGLRLHGRNIETKIDKGEKVIGGSAEVKTE